MAPSIGDIQKRLGLKGAIIRGGEQWKTEEIKDLEKAIRGFYQKYEPFLKRNEDYPAEFDHDIAAILRYHGEKVWPSNVIRSEATTAWLYLAGEIPEYLEDLYHDRHMDKIQPLFRSLLESKVKIYRGNQKHAESLRQKRAEEAVAAAAIATTPAPSDSDLTDFDSSGETPSLVHVIKMENHVNRAKLKAIVMGEEFSPRKRKVSDSSLIAVKRSKQSAAAEHEYVQNMPTWTTTNNDTPWGENSQRFESAPELLVSAASGLTHGFVPVNLPHLESHAQPRLQEVSDSDEGASVHGRATLSLHSSDGSCPDLESGAHHLPDTPSEGVTLSSGMQYSLPQETPFRAQMTATTKPVQNSLENPLDVTTESPVLPVGEFVPWPKVNNRRAKRSKKPLRPMLANEDCDSTPELASRGSQNLMDLPSRPSSGVSTSPLLQQDDSLSAEADAIDSNSSKEKRKLKRRTNWTDPPASDSSERRSDIASNDTPSAQKDAPDHLTPLSSHTRTHHTPSVDEHPHQATQQHAASPVDAVVGTPNLQHMPVNSPSMTAGPTIIDKQMTPTCNMPVSTQLIITHFGKTFVKFNLAINGRSFLKMNKLGDCSDAVRLHEIVNNRFKHALQGQVPTEIAFTIDDNEYAIDTDEGGQVLYDEFLQVLLDNGPRSSPIVAEVRV